MKSLPSLLAVAVFFLAACSPQVSVYRPNPADLSAYKTFAFLPNADIETKSGDMESDKVNQAVVAALNEEMRKDGYVLDRDNPDLLVLLSVKTDRETTTTTDPIYASDYAYYGAYSRRPGVGVSPYYNDYYYNDYMAYDNVVGYDTDTYTYKEGTLVVDIVDRAKREVVWKGVSQTPVTNSRSNAVQLMVDAIFEEFPTKAGASASR